MSEAVKNPLGRKFVVFFSISKQRPQASSASRIYSEIPKQLLSQTSYCPYYFEEDSKKKRMIKPRIGWATITGRRTRARRRLTQAHLPEFRRGNDSDFIRFDNDSKRDPESLEVFLTATDLV